MTAEDVRMLEQRWRESGSIKDEAAWLLAQVEAGDLERAQLELAVHCGHPAAALATATEIPELEPPAWISKLSRWGVVALQRAAVAAARCAVVSHLYLFHAEKRPLRAVEETEAKLMGLESSFERNMVFQRVLGAAESCARDASGTGNELLRAVASAAYSAAWSMVPRQGAGNEVELSRVVEHRAGQALAAACEAAGVEAALGAAQAELSQWALHRGDPLGERETAGLLTLTSNAPEGWRALKIEACHLAPPQHPNRELLNNIVFAKALQEAGLQLVAGDWELFFPQGVLLVPFLVEDGPSRYGVFWFPDGTAEAATRWATIRRLYASLEWPDPVFYARGELPEVEPLEVSEVLSTLQLGSMAVDPELEPGRYAMWWSTPGDTDFAASAARKNLERIYHALDGLEHHVLPRVRAALMPTDPQPPGPSPLPAEEQTIPLQGPRFQRLALTLGLRRGFCFSFPIESTPPAFRDGCLNQLAIWAEEQAAACASLPRTAEDPRPRAWWDELVEAAAQDGPAVVGELAR